MFKVQSINSKELTSELPCDFSDLQGLINRSQSIKFSFRNWTFDFQTDKTEIEVTRPIPGLEFSRYISDSKGCSTLLALKYR